MFYNQDVLTNRKHGVATVWLVATLGAKSNVRKVNRKTILGVDVLKACDTIVDIVAPFALRTQGSLLYGVSRVYSQQCQYVLSDVHSFQERLRSYEIVAHDNNIDIEIGRSRPDLLNLSDDPAFLPELDLCLDLSLFDISTQTSRSRSASVFSSSGNVSSNSGIDDEPQFIFPSVDTPLQFGVTGGPATSSFGQSASAAKPLPAVDTSDILQEPLFDFDAEDNFYELPTAAEQARGIASQAVSRAASLTALPGTTQVTATTSAGEAPQAFEDNFDNAPDFIDDLQPDLLAMSQQSAQQVRQATEDVSIHPPTEELATAAEATQPRTKRAKEVVPDRQTTLSNRELAEWNENYVANMERASRVKEEYKSLAAAKKRAAFWVFDQGIGNTGELVSGHEASHPLSVFHGQALLEALGCFKASSTGRKRSRDPSEEDSDEEGRRVRVRSNEGENQTLGEFQDVEMGISGDGDDLMATGDIVPEVEIGRHAPPSLADRSSRQMPWNISASRQGRVHRLDNAVGRSSSSLRSATGFELGPPSALRRRGSRLTTPSPLFAKSQHLGRFSRVSSLEFASRRGRSSSGGQLDDFDTAELGLGNDLPDDFDIGGPPSQSSAQEAVQSPWIATTLETEAQNFLAFLQTQIMKKQKNDVQPDDEPFSNSATFEEILPTRLHRKPTASQALLHLLALASKDFIGVEQTDAFGDITLTLKGEEEEEVEVDDGAADVDIPAAIAANVQEEVVIAE